MGQPAVDEQHDGQPESRCKNSRMAEAGASRWHRMRQPFRIGRGCHRIRMKDDIGDEAISAPGHRNEVTVFTRQFSESMAKNRDDLSEVVLLDDAPGPEIAQELVFRQQLATVLYEQKKRCDGFGRDRQRIFIVLRKQHPAPHVEPEVRELADDMRRDAAVVAHTAWERFRAGQPSGRSFPSSQIFTPGSTPCGRRSPYPSNWAGSVRG